MDFTSSLGHIFVFYTDSYYNIVNYVAYMNSILIYILSDQKINTYILKSTMLVFKFFKHRYFTLFYTNACAYLRIIIFNNTNIRLKRTENECYWHY